MWNHNRRLKDAQANLTDDDLKAVTGYLWSIGVFEQPGNARRGERFYSSLGCASCHDGSGARDLRATRQARQWPFSVYFTAELWNHGPAMLQYMQKRGVTWPQVDGAKWGDLAAFLDK
jgi:hypothetical protein